MQGKDLFNALSGLYAYDMGATDSGIKDEELRRKVKELLNEMADKEYYNCLSLFIRDMFLSNEALEKGYSLEDAIQFIKWLRDYMDIDLF